MLIEFACKDTERLYHDLRVKRFSAFERIAQRKLFMLANADKVEDLRSPPGNRLEQLKGDRKGQWSIRINQQWRICFRVDDDFAYDIEIIDYH